MEPGRDESAVREGRSKEPGGVARALFGRVFEAEMEAEIAAARGALEEARALLENALDKAAGEIQDGSSDAEGGATP